MNQVWSTSNTEMNKLFMMHAFGRHFSAQFKDLNRYDPLSFKSRDDSVKVWCGTKSYKFRSKKPTVKQDKFKLLANHKNAGGEAFIMYAYNDRAINKPKETQNFITHPPKKWCFYDMTDLVIGSPEDDDITRQDRVTVDPDNAKDDVYLLPLSEKIQLELPLQILLDTINDIKGSIK